MHSTSWYGMSKQQQSGPPTFTQALALAHSPGHGKQQQQQQQQLRQSGSVLVRDHGLQDRQLQGNLSGQMQCQLKGKMGRELPGYKEVPAKAQGGSLSASQQEQQQGRQQNRQAVAHVGKQGGAAQVL